MARRLVGGAAAALLVLLMLAMGANLWAGSHDCCEIRLNPNPPNRDIHAQYSAICPRSNIAVRCYRYRWDSVSSKPRTDLFGPGDYRNLFCAKKKTRKHEISESTKS